MIKIAVAEDEQSCIDTVQQFLSDFSKEKGILFDVHVFRNGEQLVFNYQADYDIILLDIEMPGMDGMTAAEKIRETDKDVIIIFITNMAQYAVQGYRVRIGEIYFLESQRHRMIFHLKDRTLQMRGTMKEMEERLGKYYFVRCNVSYLVNLAHVSGIEGDMAVVGDERVPISRQKRKSFMAALSEYMGGGADI